MSPFVLLTIPTTTSPVRVTRLRKLPASVDQATMTLAGSSAALPVSARYSDFVRAPMGPIERSSGHGAWKAEVSAALDVGESWNLGVFLAHALKAHGRLQEQQSDAPGDAPQAVWATGAVDVIDLRILPVGHIETKLRQALGATPVPDLFLLPPDNLGDVPAELRADLEARGTRIIAPATMSEALEALGLPSDWAKEATPDLAGWRGDPYRGLEAYQAEHRPIFFGRSSARAEALERLRTRAERGTSLLVIHGRSGVGKSSLAMAGLLDDVVEQVPGRAPFGTATIRFGDGATPLAALREGFAQALGLEAASALQSSSAAEWLKTFPGNSEPRTLLLILDQLEQALLADEADSIAFGEAIATLVQTGRVWVIATLRSDRIDLLERAPALAEMADGDALYRLVRPTLAELGEIIRAPAKLAGIAFEEGSGTDLVNLLAEEAMRAPDSLPLLQVTLMRLADQRDAEGRVGMRDYERIGGFSGAVGRLADETVRKMEADGIDGNVVDRTLASLVRIDPDTDRVDARVVDPDAQTAKVQQVLSALVEARLATASTVSEALDPDADGGRDDSAGPNDSGRRVRLAHETLIREWPRLHDLAARLRSELSLRDRLEDDALRWEQDGCPTGDLIRNTARLTAAEALITEGLATPSQQAQTYIEASRAEVERQAEQRRAAAALEQRTRTRRRITTAAAIVAFVILGLTGFAINQAQQTRAAQELAEIQAEATKQAEQAAELQASLTEEQKRRREAAEQAATEARRLTQTATEAQRKAEEQLKQAQISQTQHLVERAKSLAQENPSHATALLTEIPFDLDVLKDMGLEREVLNATAAIDLLDREITRVHFRNWGELSISPDATQVAIRYFDNSLLILDVISGEPISILEGHEDWINSANFSPDGSKITTASRDESIRIWSTSTGELRQTLTLNKDSVASVSFSADGSYIVAGYFDGTALILDSESGQILKTLQGHRDAILSVSLSPTGKLAATGSRDGTVRVWEVASGSVAQVFEAGSVVKSIAFSPDESMVISGSEDKTARIWDVETGKVRQTLNGHSYGIYGVEFSPDGSLVLTSSADGSVWLWSAVTGKGIRHFEFANQNHSSAAKFLADGSIIATEASRDTIRLFKFLTYTPRQTLVFSGNPLKTAVFSPDNSQILAAGHSVPNWLTGGGDVTSSVPKIYDTDTNMLLRLLKGHEGNVNSALFSFDGARIVTASQDGSIRIWNTASGESIKIIQNRDAPIYHAEFSPNGSQILASFQDGTFLILNSTTGETVFSVGGNEEALGNARFSPDGKRIVAAVSPNAARIWSSISGEVLLELTEGSISSDSQLSVDLPTVRFSPDSKKIVAGFYDGSATIWDSRTGQVVLKHTPHRGRITEAKFSPDGSLVATSSTDQATLLWDSTNGNLLVRLEAHQESFATLDFSTDGNWILTGEENGDIRVWDVGLLKEQRMRYDFLPLVIYERAPKLVSRSVSKFEPDFIELLSKNRVESLESNGSWEIHRTPNIDIALENWKAAAIRGVPEAHEALSTAFLTSKEGLKQDFEAALFHAAIATRIYEALGDVEPAARMRIRRANLARSLPPQTVASLWPHIRDWRPLEKE